MKYELWNRKEAINGKEASYFLNQLPFKNCTHDIILIYGNNEKVSRIECKDILAKIYNIDVNLPIYKFMEEYQAKLEETEEE